MQFEDAERLFKSEDIKALAESPDGQRYLKLRSCSRSGKLIKVFEKAGIIPLETTNSKLFKEAYTAGISAAKIDLAIRSIYEEDRKQRRDNENNLINELYKLEVFDWGGLHQNSLEKTIVDNYIKKIPSYDDLETKIEGELHNSLRGYVLCSWYNHWTSILIEDIFKDHKNVLPAVGQVKMIDFFVNDMPFDLKVTYLPEGFVSEQRRLAGEKQETSLLKIAAKASQIPIDVSLAGSKLLEDLWKKVSDDPAGHSQKLIAELRKKRKSILDGIAADPSVLIKWLYENQGVRRFDASNRLFLIAVDEQDFFASWKLKRMAPRLRDAINRYLDNAGVNPGAEIEFEWEGATYTSRADIILVNKP